MSKDKQIEKMAWDICDIPKHPSIKSCEQCGNKHCHAMYYAERAYNKDYRKQSEGEWQITPHAWGTSANIKCSRCGLCVTVNDERCDFSRVLPKYCSECGAKMKGENK